MRQSKLADGVLVRMVDAYNRAPDGRFVLAKAVSGRGKYRISHPGGSLGIDAALVDDLIKRRLLSVSAQQPGFRILTITLRGFDYVAHLGEAERDQAGGQGYEPDLYSTDE